MTREQAILWMQVLKHAQINWVGEQAEDEDIIARCEEAEQEAFDMAIKALSTDAISREEHEEVKAYMDTLVDAFIEDGEELAESVKVVRCKDCKWQKFIDWGMGDCLHPKGSKHIAYDNHFCSYGERRK